MHAPTQVLSMQLCPRAAIAPDVTNVTMLDLFISGFREENEPSGRTSSVTHEGPKARPEREMR